MLLHFYAHRLWQTVKLHNLVERRFVERAADKPALVSITIKVALTQIFDPDQAFRRVVKINLWHADSLPVEKLRDLDVMPVLFALQIVFNED